MNELIKMLEYLLEMPSVCTKDDEIIENNKRRYEAKKLLEKYKNSVDKLN